MRYHTISIMGVEPVCTWTKARVEETFVLTPMVAKDWKGRIKLKIVSYCWNMLVRLHAVEEKWENIGSAVSYHTAVVDLDHLEREIAKKEDDIMRLYNREARMIVCNASHLDAMRDITRPIRFSYPTPPSNMGVRDIGGYTRLDFHGMEVVVLPWVKDIILIPKLD